MTGSQEFFRRLPGDCRIGAVASILFGDANRLPTASAAPRFDCVSEDSSEPDYRFTLANERTFLAWIRTSLALLAGGVALMQLVPSFGIPGVKHGLSVVLVLIGGLLSVFAVQRWRQVQDAMSRGADLPANRHPVWLGSTLLLVAVVLLVLIIFEPNAH